MGQEEQAYNLEAIRDLMDWSFTEEELQQFCQERPLFQQVTHRFGPGHSLEEMVDEVMVYALRWNLFTELLSEIAETRPRQFGRYVASIFQQGERRIGVADALLILAQTFQEKEAYAEASRLARRALEADPRSERARRLYLEATYREGIHLYEEHQDLRGACQALEQVVAVDPSYQEAARLLQEVEQRLEDVAPPGGWVRERSSRRVVPGWVWLAALLAVALIAGFVLVLALGRGDDGSRHRMTATTTSAPAVTDADVPATTPTTRVEIVSTRPATATLTPEPTYTPLPAATAPDPTLTPRPTHTHTPAPTQQPSATAITRTSPTPTWMASPIPTTQPSPTAQSPTTTERKPSATPTLSPIWFWQDFGPFQAQNGAMAFVNYTDEVLTVRMFDFDRGLTGVYDVPAQTGSSLALELPPGRYAIHARTPSTPGMYVAVLPTCTREAQWHCEILDSLRVYKRRALVLAFAIQHGTAQNPEERRLDLAGCPWLERETSP